MTEKHPASSDGHEPTPVTIAKVPAKFISYSHTIFAYSAFLLALAAGCYTHYYKIVQNEYYGYPDGFPSVSATTGDRYPARAIFQIFIALTSGPRFALVFLWYFYTTRSSRSSSPAFGKFLLIVGLVRTISCGGWTYITSTDDHLAHDIAMIVYLICTLPWQLGGLYTTPIRNPAALKWRRFFTIAFFASLPPMIYFFLQHKVHKIPGAYTTYAFFEWSLILYDVAFDAVTALDFQTFEFSIVDYSGNSAPSPVTFSKEGSAKIPGHTEDTISPVALRSLTLARGFITETYLAYVFWSLLTSLALLIWYFPLWHMGISGFEAFLFITLTPMILGIGPLRRLFAQHRGVFHLLSLIGIASYLKLDPVWRLSLTAVGLAISLTTWCATWIETRHHTGTLDRSILIWGLGLLVHNVMKFAWWSENPIWPIMHKANGGINEIGIVLGVIASLEVLMRDRTNPISLASSSNDTIGRRQDGSNWLLASAGFGSLVFALHSMYSDSSTIMRWSVDGYPNYGPEPVPWGVATIGSLAFGLLLSTHRSLVTSLPWYVFGCIGCIVFYAYSGWTAYYGGLALGTVLTSVMPILVRSITVHGPFKTLFTSFMIYNILCLAHVWVVAYAFVPGGVYARERTNWVLGTMMFLIGCGLFNARKQEADSGIVQLGGQKVKKVGQLHIIKNTRFLTRLSVVGIMVSSILVALNRNLSAVTPAPFTSSAKSFTAAIWTIHFALDDDMWASEVRMRDALRDLELDVVGLLESDTQRIIMGNRDWAQFIAEDLGYYVDYGPSTMKHTWGCLMLSKFPIIKSSHHLLPSPVGELACAIHATLDVYGQPVDFIVSHNGQEEDPVDRELQTTELARIMRTSPNPFVFLGYVVTKPHQYLYNLLFDGGDMNDIDITDDWDRWCEYIGYRGLKRVAYARISHGKITDTEIQSGKFQVVDDPRQYWKASYDRVPESSIQPELRYPQMFRGNGVRGHRYQVFDEPRYYIH
ncbi:Frag1/DRAM/Sfk1 family-domain-containing protein [Halteromyces radiatus]|uniref:Frag1/DRAM/Sfk1 family-domain-containing protein n=1 Tax=Halteromyces radiatus TaxID=101107 RepID=UPI00221EADAE|nr:Frag1/DRAM/Sfk1 family-domain-containing protein [Halteromyces radiatus]KAI8081732.1 Frag1/DRAM/Sfk1 family-domain-containing protein [Halteromyces radiatus]